MSEPGPIRVFVTHLFERHADYLRVFEYLESVENFRYVNLSNPDAVAGGADAQKEELRNQIRHAEVVVMPISIYEAGRELAGFQLDAAAAFKKPVLAVRAFGDTVVMPRDLLARVEDVVEWNERTLADAIRLQARHEETARWDVIEFKLD